MRVSPVLQSQSVEDDRTRASDESEKSASGKTENDGLARIEPFDIYSEEYPDGGATAWLVVFGVSKHLDLNCVQQLTTIAGSVYDLFNVCASFFSNPDPGLTRLKGLVISTHGVFSKRITRRPCLKIRRPQTCVLFRILYVHF